MTLLPRRFSQWRWQSSPGSPTALESAFSSRDSTSWATSTSDLINNTGATRMDSCCHVVSTGRPVTHTCVRVSWREGGLLGHCRHTHRFLWTPKREKVNFFFQITLFFNPYHCRYIALERTCLNQDHVNSCSVELATNFAHLFGTASAFT